MKHSMLGLMAIAFWYFIAVVPNGQGGWATDQYNNFFSAADCDKVAAQLHAINPQIAVTQCFQNVSPGGVQ